MFLLATHLLLKTTKAFGSMVGPNCKLTHTYFNMFRIQQIRIRFIIYKYNNSSSSSSSNTVQGSVLLPHYRTLEVRPGRIS